MACHEVAPWKLALPLILLGSGLGLGLEQFRVRVRVSCFGVTGGHKWVLYGSIAEGGGSGSASGLWLEGRLRSMLTVMLGGDMDVATWV